MACRLASMIKGLQQHMTMVMFIFDWSTAATKRNNIILISLQTMMYDQDVAFSH